MNISQLFDKIKNIFAITIIIILIILYFGVFNPLRSELINSLKNNFDHSVSISEINLENYLDRSIEGAKSLSSRTMIRKKLDSFVNNEITFEELRGYTQKNMWMEQEYWTTLFLLIEKVKGCWLLIMGIII